MRSHRRDYPSPSPVERANLTTLILDKLRQYVVAHGLSTDDRLPPERDLAARLRVSRPSLRNALEWLNQREAVRRVQGGGTFLQENFLTVVAQSNGSGALDEVSLNELVEARRHLEPLVARLLVDRIPDAALAELKAEVQRARANHDDANLWRQHNLQFHTRLAQECGNRILARTLEEILAEVLAFWATRSEKSEIARSHAEHGAIVEAIAARDGDRAAELMAAHVEHFAFAVADQKEA